MSGPNLRLAALRRFAITISVLNVLGHTVLGFENSWAQMVVALLTAYGTEIFWRLLMHGPARDHRRLLEA